jgi:hypothetical protein
MEAAPQVLDLNDLHTGSNAGGHIGVTANSPESVRTSMPHGYAREVCVESSGGGQPFEADLR